MSSCFDGSGAKFLMLSICFDVSPTVRVCCAVFKSGPEADSKTLNRIIILESRHRFFRPQPYPDQGVCFKISGFSH